MSIFKEKLASAFKFLKLFPFVFFSDSMTEDKYEKAKKLVADEVSLTEGVAAFKAPEPISEQDKEKLRSLLNRVKSLEETVAKYKAFVANEKKALNDIRSLKAKLGSQLEDIHFLNSSLPAHMKPQEQLSTSQILKYTDFRSEKASKRVSALPSEPVPRKKAKK